MSAPTNGTTHGASSYDADLDTLYAWMPPQTPAAPCPEAALSLTLRGTMGGHEALLTVRGQTAAEFKRHLEAIRGLLDAPARPTPQASSQGQGKDWCQVHNVAMTLNQKEGRSWWSHKTADGWCKGK